MSDLNDWRLEYGSVSLDFGTLSTDYPFAVQVDIGDTDITDQDAPHPTTDGVVMGIDNLGGFDLTFDIKTIPDFPIPAKPWVQSLDLFSSFQAAWRADAIRRTPGAYATLTNLDRQRLVYGRPRKIAKKTERLRKGLLEFIATFTTNGPNYYDMTQKAAVITPVPPPSAGITAPLTDPLTTETIANEIAPMVNEGDLETWPIITIHGPGTGIAFELLDGPDTVWAISVTGNLVFDQVMVIDTRPWSRSATINGKPANGRLRGTALEACRVPVGDFNARFKVKDQTGTAFATIEWRDAYASL